jgi:hypothetical protein
LAEASTKPAGWKELLLGGTFSAGFDDGFLMMDFRESIYSPPNRNSSPILYFQHFSLRSFNQNLA